MKAVVLLSKKFFPAHFRAGEATDFKAKVLNGQKRHTCRCNYEYWKKKITALQEKAVRYAYDNGRTNRIEARRKVF